MAAGERDSPQVKFWSPVLEILAAAASEQLAGRCASASALIPRHLCVDGDRAVAAFVISPERSISPKFPEPSMKVGYGPLVICPAIIQNRGLCDRG
jgi:hypothetical protein